MVRITTCFAFLLSLVATSEAQNQRVVDSLERVLITANGNDRLSPLINLAIEFVDNDNERALTFIEQANSGALSLGDSLWIAKCLRIKGQILRRLGRFDDAFQLLSLALNIAERNGLDEERLKILISYAVILTYKSQYDQALQMYSIAHELAIARADTVNLRLVLSDLGVIYYKLKDYSKALHLWQSVIQLQKARPLDGLLLNISLAHANLQDYESARSALNRSLSECRENCSPALLVHIHYVSGVIFLGLKDYDNAEREFLTSYELSKKLKDVRMLLDNVYLLAEVYQEKDQTDLALFYLKEGENFIDQGVAFNLEITKIYQRLSEVYLDQHDFRKAAQYQAQYISLKDSIYNEELTIRLMKAEADHLERFNRAQIASQKEVILLKEQVIKRQRTLNVVIVLLALFILACCVFLYRNFRLKQLMNISLEDRIRARTHELECSRSEMLAALKERDALLGRAEKEVLETMRTIKGLCDTGKGELNRFATYSYLEKIEQTSGRLSGHLSLLFAGTRHG